jgi:hypothetical protein
VLHGEVRLRVREIIRQVCVEMGVTIINGALSRDHVHMFAEIPPHVSVSDFVRRAKGRDLLQSGMTQSVWARNCSNGYVLVWPFSDSGLNENESAMLRKATFRIAFSSGQFRLKRHARLAPRLAETGDIPYNSCGRILGSGEFKMKIGNFVLLFQKQGAGEYPDRKSMEKITQRDR